MSSGSYEISRQRHWLCALQIAERRRELGLTQQEVVDRLAALGVVATNRTLSAMEHGQGLDVGRLPELAFALDCTVTYLLGLTVDPRRWVPDAEIALDQAQAGLEAAEHACDEAPCWLSPPPSPPIGAPLDAARLPGVGGPRPLTGTTNGGPGGGYPAGSGSRRPAQVRRA